MNRFFIFSTIKQTLFICFVTMFLVACNKENQNAPEEVISKSVLKSYFPYEKGDKMMYRNPNILNDIVYEVISTDYIEKNGQKTLNVSMRGVPTVVYADGDYILNLSAEVTGKSLSVSFYQGLDVVSDLPIAIDVEDKYVYELKNELDSLPNKLIFPKGSVIKKDEGLLIYYDFDEVKWNFLKRL